MLRVTSVAIASLITILANSPMSYADESQSLMTRIAEWQYPDSKLNGATMSDAATLNGNGERTIPSIQCKTVMTTTDPITKVVEYYRAKLEPDSAPDKSKPINKLAIDTAQSVTFHDDFENRPLAIYMILVNGDKTSTTLVISRGEAESETHIAWTQYAKL